MKKGITMVSLLTVMASMIILISVVTISSVNISNTSKKMAFASELKMIQDSVDSYKTKNNGEYPVSDFVNVDISGLSESSKAQFLNNSEEIAEDKVFLRKVDYAKLSLVSISRGLGESDESDIYAVSTKTGKVYYVKGLNIGKTTYYTITGELQKLIMYNRKNDEVLANNAIVFETSKIEWTNESITGKLKIPEEYTNISISVNGSIITTYDLTTNENEKIYTLEIKNNCVIDVKYNDEDNIEKTASYTISNIDQTVPTINVDNIENSNKEKLYLNINASDMQSGIKALKYDIGKINDDEVGRVYFNSNGTEIKGNVIELEKDVRYVTIYVEDSAGNYDIVMVNV